MYKEKEDIPEFEKFYLPFEGHLNGENRGWSFRRSYTGWDRKGFCEVFFQAHRKERKAGKLGIWFSIDQKKITPDGWGTVEQIQENPCLQFFLGYEL
jgi:hypothetical protein